jgi:hypothetical protein
MGMLASVVVGGSRVWQGAMTGALLSLAMLAFITRRLDG